MSHLIKYPRGIQPPGASLEARIDHAVPVGDSGRCCICCHVEAQTAASSARQSRRSYALQSAASLLSLKGGL